MWSQIVLCLLVGVALASKNPAWKSDTEYVYRVEGRSLTGLQDMSNDYSGMLFKAQLYIRPKQNGALYGQIMKPEYAQIHVNLPQGWNTPLPESEVSYKSMPLSGKPFQLKMDDGVIRDLVVEKGVSNWEANIIRSVVSQFQLDTQAKNLIPSQVNVLPEHDRNDGVFKTMEDTVTGNTETLYEIHPMPEQILSEKPWLVPRQELLSGEGQIIEVLKHKNYTQFEESPSYHFGLSGAGRWEPSSNQIGQFFVRNSIGHAVLTGSLKRFIVQSSHTINKIVVSPNLNNNEKASVVSMMNVTLSEVRSKSGEPQELASPISLGNLVYRYNDPFANNEARTKSRQDSQESYEQTQSSSEEDYRIPVGRFRRSLDQHLRRHHDSQYKRRSQNVQLQEKPQMTSVPQIPLLPYMMGYHGNSMKMDRSVDLKQNVEKLAQQIGEDLQQPNSILEQSTLSKFNILNTLIRLLDAKELQEAAKTMYSPAQEGTERMRWIVFRDSVAEAGTGPAFLAIREWIQTQKIKEYEAAAVVSTMAKSVRIPTEEYMRQFFELIQNQQVQQQHQLKESALLAYTDLVRKVYADKYVSHNQFPVHIFGTFYTQEGREFMKNTVIPYLTQKLHESISNADTHKIHLYIRALGNVGHRKILEAFEPYLEGTKQASQFQRLLMVVALDKLTRTDPMVARSVLYKIYQNTAENKEVRVAAVYQLMRTSPPTDILQRMAEFTHEDKEEHVNAAVKSAIQSAARLQSEESKFLRSSAQAAEPLLTKKTYGKLQGINDLKDYVIRELKLKYKQNYQEIASDDEFWPKALKYSLRESMGGLDEYIFDSQALVSSIDELFNALDEQTEKYQENKAKRGAQDESSQWSSSKIAKLLKLVTDEREQLEGNFNIEVGSFKKLFSFDNHSIERFPELVRQWEEKLSKGKHIHYTKLYKQEEIAISVPTEMGWPLLFTYDIPVLVDFHGKVQGSANPSVVSNDKFKKPETVSGKIDLAVTMSAKIQSSVSFVTPFDHQQYSSGFDRNMQVHIPINADFEVDTKKQELKMDFEIKEQHDGARLFHYSCWPYTSRKDILSLVPVALSPNTHAIKQHNERSHHFDRTVGKESTGIAFRVYGNIEQPSMDSLRLVRLFQGEEMNPLNILWRETSLDQCEFNLQLVPQQSRTKKITVRLGYQQEYRQQAKQQDTTFNLKHMSKYLNDPLSRQNHLIDEAGAGINSAKIASLDCQVEFQGEKQIKHVFSAAVGKSDVDPNCRVLAYYRNNQNDKPYQMAVRVKGHIPNTNALDLTYTMKNGPTAKFSMEVTSEREGESTSKISGQVDMRRSEERTQYLQKQPLYKQCQQEMQEGNKQLYACANMTIRANKLDRIDYVLKSENLKSEFKQYVKTLFEGFRIFFYPSLNINDNGNGEQDKVSGQIRFHPDLKAVNVTVKTQNQENEITNIRVSEWAKEALVMQPVFHLRSRLVGKSLGLSLYRPICVVDQTSALTYNNRTYPITLGEDWTVALMYVPKMARTNAQWTGKSVEQQLENQKENFAILVRKNKQNSQQKDVLLTIRAPGTHEKMTEIKMEPSNSHPLAKILVDGQEIQVSDKHTKEIKNQYIQAYALPNGEVKVEVRDEFYVIYDGKRVKVTALSGKFRNSIVGLCGAFNDDRTEDFTVPQNCIAKDVRQFVQSYELKQGQQKLSQEQCYEKTTPQYVNVIADQDSGRKSKAGCETCGCTVHQTRYIEDNGEICFTRHPMPVCKCQEKGTITKSVSVHCIQKSNMANVFKTQIDRGLNPNFSEKSETRTIQMQLPQGCSQ